MRNLDRYIPISFVVVSSVVCLSLLPESRRETLFIPHNVIDVSGIGMLSTDVNDAFESSWLLDEEHYIISPYDLMFRRIGHRYGIDWRFLSALSFYESRFNADAISPRGAVGLMQIMPSVAGALGFPCISIQKPFVNIEASCRILKLFERTVRSFGVRSGRDMDALLLVCYNSGSVHLRDALRLAEFYGETTIDWETVKEYLLLLDNADFYENEVVEAGRFAECDLTVEFVDRVLEKYDFYLEFTSRPHLKNKL